MPLQRDQPFGERSQWALWQSKRRERRASLALAPLFCATVTAKPIEIWRANGGKLTVSRRSLTVAFALTLLLLLPCLAWSDSLQGDSWDFPLDTRAADSGIGVNLSDSPDFTLNTTGSDLAAAGVLQSDSADFVLDTTPADTGLGVLASDSPDFILDTTGADSGLAIGISDSADFILDTTGSDAVAGGWLLADSADFPLDTRGLDGGGLLLADSSDFVLDTLDWLDIGLRVYDGLVALKIAVEAPGVGGQLASALRVTKGGTNYGILLIPTHWPDASPVRIQTSTGTKAWRKLP